MTNENPSLSQKKKSGLVASIAITVAVFIALSFIEKYTSLKAENTSLRSANAEFAVVVKGLEKDIIDLTTAVKVKDGYIEKANGDIKDIRNNTGIKVDRVLHHSLSNKCDEGVLYLKSELNTMVTEWKN
jgi:hypothetical protein